MILQHVALETRPDDAGAAVRFWALLGFAEVVAPGSLAQRSRWVERDGVQVHLLLTGDPVAPPSGHVALALGDAYEATLERLRAAGFAPEPREEHWGSPRSFVRAPGGHRVELMAAPPA